MLQQNTTKRIGYWLLHLHQQFDAATAAVLRGEGLNRRQWQILHALEIGLRTVAELDRAFAPFLRADGAQSYRPIVDEFRGRGWVEVADGIVRLTAAGIAAHERAEALVNAHAAESLRGITEPEFLAANAVLAKIAGNIADE
ncbi:MarR family winged helix-turn-helix transcriptional regulator [Nocardia sp. NPDC003963]